MSKEANVVNKEQLERAAFEKFFGDAKEMYIPAIESDISKYLEKHSENFYVFIVPREKPLISGRFLPKQLLEDTTHQLVAQPGEFFVFQVVVWTPESGLFHVNANASNAVNFVKPGNLRGGEVKIFWFGMDVPDMADVQHAQRAAKRHIERMLEQYDAK